MRLFFWKQFRRILKRLGKSLCLLLRRIFPDAGFGYEITAAQQLITFDKFIMIQRFWWMGSQDCREAGFNTPALVNAKTEHKNEKKCSLKEPKIHIELRKIECSRN